VSARKTFVSPKHEKRDLTHRRIALIAPPGLVNQDSPDPESGGCQLHRLGRSNAYKHKRAETTSYGARPLPITSSTGVLRNSALNRGTSCVITSVNTRVASARRCARTS